MRVLMISLDKGLVGAKPLGDVIERHRKYGEFVDRLDIIVLSKKGYEPLEISKNVHTAPTNSLLSIFSYANDALKIAREWFRIQKYDLIVTQDPFITGWVGLKLKKEFKTKLLIHMHGDYALRFFTKKVISGADAVRVMSEGQKNKLVSSGIHPDKVRIISTPIDLYRFINYPSTFAEKKQIESLTRMVGGKKLILFVGRKDKVKDIGTFFKAVREVIGRKGKDSVALYLVGDYSANYVPKDLSEAVFSGPERIEGKDMPASYYVSYLLASTSLSESFGKVFVEASACAKPVVATETTGAKEIIKEGENGFLVPIGDYTKLAGRILQLIDDEDLARKMGERGRNLVVEKYSKNLEKVVNFWKEIL